MADKEASFREGNSELSFGWDTGHMRICLEEFLPTNPHKLNLFSKALNDNVGHTPFGYPSAGRLVLDYIDVAITEAEESIIDQKALFSKAAEAAHLKILDYDKLCEFFGGDKKLTDALSKHAGPLKQKLTDVSRRLKASQKKLAAAQKGKGPSWYIKDGSPPWYISELQYVISEHERQIGEIQTEYLPWKTMLSTHKKICDSLAKAGQLTRNKDFLSKKLKEVQIYETQIPTQE